MPVNNWNKNLRCYDWIDDVFVCNNYSIMMAVSCTVQYFAVKMSFVQVGSQELSW